MKCSESKHLHADVEVAVTSRNSSSLIDTVNKLQVPKELDILGKCWPGRLQGVCFSTVTLSNGFPETG